MIQIYFPNVPDNARMLIQTRLVEVRIGGAFTTCFNSLANFRYPGGFLGRSFFLCPLPCRLGLPSPRLLRGQNVPCQPLSADAPQDTFWNRSASVACRSL